MATGRATLPAAVIVSLALWAVKFYDYYQIAGMAVCFISTYLLVGLNSAFGIVTTKSYLTPAMFAFMYTAFSFTADFHSITSVIPLLFIGSIFFIIRGYDSINPPADVFNSFLSAGIGCMIDRHIIFAVPVLFICMTQLKSISVRGFLSAILGFGVPFWIMYGYFILRGKTEELSGMASDFFSFGLPDFSSMNIITWICIAVVFLIFLSSAILARKISLEDKVKNRSVIKSMNSTGTYLFAVMILVPQTGVTLLPVAMLVTSIIFGYVMTQLYNRFTMIQMIVSLLMVAGIAAYGIIL